MYVSILVCLYLRERVVATRCCTMPRFFECMAKMTDLEEKYMYMYTAESETEGGHVFVSGHQLYAS